MGIFSTLTTFGVGYVAGAMTGPRAKQRLSATVEQLPDATKEHYRGEVFLRGVPVGGPISWDNARIRLRG